MEEDQIYEVEKVLDKRKVRNKVQYLIKWKHYPEEQASWEEFSHLQSIKPLILEFNQQRKSLNKRKKSKGKSKNTFSASKKANISCQGRPKQIPSIAEQKEKVKTIFSRSSIIKNQAKTQNQSLMEDPLFETKKSEDNGDESEEHFSLFLKNKNKKVKTENLVNEIRQKISVNQTIQEFNSSQKEDKESDTLNLTLKPIGPICCNTQNSIEYSIMFQNTSLNSINLRGLSPFQTKKPLPLTPSEIITENDMFAKQQYSSHTESEKKQVVTDVYKDVDKINAKDEVKKIFFLEVKQGQIWYLLEMKSGQLKKWEKNELFAQHPKQFICYLEEELLKYKRN